MADETEEQNGVQGDNGLDLAAAAQEYAAAQGEQPSETEETSLDENEGEDEPEAEEQEAEDNNADEEDSESDDEFLTQNKGRNIPYSAFQKKYQKWKGREAKALEEAKKLRDEFDAYKRGAQATPEQLATFKRLEAVFGNFDKAATSKPWLLDALMAMGRGEEPNWRALNEALSKHVETLPQGDPVLAKQVQELVERQQRFEEERFSSSIRDHVAKEDSEIRKLIGDDKTAWRMLNQIAAESVPERGDVSHLPNRVEIAKQIVAWAEARNQAVLKTRVPAKPAAKAAINAGRGPSGRADTSGDPPEPGTEEYRRWAAGL